MQANNEQSFEYGPLLTEIYCLEELFDHGKRSCDPQNFPLFSMESIDLGTDIISNKRPYLSVCIQTLESGYSSYECLGFQGLCS